MGQNENLALNFQLERTWPTSRKTGCAFPIAACRPNVSGSSICKKQCRVIIRNFMQTWQWYINCLFLAFSKISHKQLPSCNKFFHLLKFILFVSAKWVEVPINHLLQNYQQKIICDQLKRKSNLHCKVWFPPILLSWRKNWWQHIGGKFRVKCWYWIENKTLV